LTDRIRGQIEAYLRGWSELISSDPASDSQLQQTTGMLRQAGARTKDALVDVLGEALSAISAQDAQGYFEHAGYRSQAQLL
jgi:hypothetical protein